MSTLLEAEPARSPAAGYRVGWPDRLADRVENLPVPAWCCYLAAWAVLFGVGALLALRDFGDGTASGKALRYYAVITGLVVYVFILKHYLRSYARVAMEGFRPVYREEDSVSGEVHTLAESLFQLTNAPAQPTLFASLAAMTLVSTLTALRLAPFQRLAIAASPLSFAFNVALELTGWAIVGATAYSFVRTLRLVSRFYTRHARVSLFEQQPLYALSALTARYGLGGIIGPSIFLAVESGLLTGWVTVTFAMAAAAGALILFAWPLVGAHHLLAAEKKALFADNTERLREALERLHAAADDGEDEKTASIHYLLSGLQGERTILQMMGTWPWRPGLLRAFLTALLLPMVIWLIQFLLARLITR